MTERTHMCKYLAKKKSREHNKAKPTIIHRNTALVMTCIPAASFIQNCLQTLQRSHHSSLERSHLSGEGEKNRLERYGEEILLKSRKREAE